MAIHYIIYTYMSKKYRLCFFNIKDYNLLFKTIYNVTYELNICRKKINLQIFIIIYSTSKLLI